MHDISLLAIIWVVVFFASYMAHKTRLTPVLWYLFGGAILVNLGILPEDMPIFIVDFAELGIIIIMFALGFEENTSNFLRSIKRSWGIAFFGAAVPFAVAYTAARIYWQDPNIALFVGLAMTATAVSLTMVSLKSEGLSNTPAATGIMTSAVLDDVASLALVAICVPIATGDATLSLDGILLIVGKAVAFFLIVVFLGGWLFPTKTGLLANVPFIGKFGLRQILSMGRGEYTVLSLLLLAVVVGLLAHEFGFHPAVGAYMAGLIVHVEYFDFHTDRNKDFYLQAREIIDNVAFSWIGPVFFVALGSELLFDQALFVTVLPKALILFAALFVGQIVSAGLAARYTGGFDWPSSVLIGFGMLGRAELAFVVMNIAFVQHQILSTDAFYTLMITLFLLNVSVPLTIRWWIGYFGHPSEKNPTQNKQAIIKESES
jgi:Kef-type K+ transport system membrane component KefB